MKRAMKGLLTLTFLRRMRRPRGGAPDSPRAQLWSDPIRRDGGYTSGL
jgi:hypothetical protein